MAAQIRVCLEREVRELPPRPDQLDFEIEGGIRPDEMLRAINRRLEKLYDRDHCIGHAYLYALRDDPTLEGLKQVFRNKPIPLLQEYFHGDWGKIGLVLGRDFVYRRDTSAMQFAEFDHDDRDALAERPSWKTWGDTPVNVSSLPIRMPRLRAAQEGGRAQVRWRLGLFGCRAKRYSPSKRMRSASPRGWFGPETSTSGTRVGSAMMSGIIFCRRASAASPCSMNSLVNQSSAECSAA